MSEGAQNYIYEWNNGNKVLLLIIEKVTSTLS